MGEQEGNIFEIFRVGDFSKDSFKERRSIRRETFTKMGKSFEYVDQDDYDMFKQCGMENGPNQDPYEIMIGDDYSTPLTSSPPQKKEYGYFLDKPLNNDVNILPTSDRMMTYFVNSMPPNDFELQWRTMQNVNNKPPIDWMSQCGLTEREPMKDEEETEDELSPVDDYSPQSNYGFNSMGMTPDIPTPGALFPNSSEQGGFGKNTNMNKRSGFDLFDDDDDEGGDRTVPAPPFEENFGKVAFGMPQYGSDTPGPTTPRVGRSSPKMDTPGYYGGNDGYGGMFQT